MASYGYISVQPVQFDLFQNWDWMGTQASFLVTASWENVLKNESNCPYTFLEKKKQPFAFSSSSTEME